MREGFMDATTAWIMGSILRTKWVNLIKRSRKLPEALLCCDRRADYLGLPTYSRLCNGQKSLQTNCCGCIGYIFGFINLVEFL